MAFFGKISRNWALAVPPKARPLSRRPARRPPAQTITDRFVGSPARRRRRCRRTTRAARYG